MTGIRSRRVRGGDDPKDVDYTPQKKVPHQSRSKRDQVCTPTPSPEQFEEEKEEENNSRD